MRRARSGPPWAVLSAAAWAAAPAGGARNLGPARCLGASPRELLLNLTSAQEYNRLDRPDVATGIPTRVEQQIYIAKLVQFDENGQTMTFSGYWRSAWLDERLAYEGEWGDCFDYLDVDLRPNLDGPPGQGPSLIWTPSLFFDNALTESYASYSFQVMPSGQVVRSIKIMHTFSCAMDFGRMPFDVQECPVRIMSYDKPDSSVTLAPKGKSFVDGTRDGNGDGPIKVDTSLWDSVAFPASVEKEGYTVGYETAFYDVLTINFVFQRNSAYSMKRDVGYAILFVLVSYVGFFVDAKSAPARAALAVIPVLTMLNHQHYVDSRLPPLPGSTWLNSFLLMSFVYTLLAVLELAIVSACLNLERARAQRMVTFETLAKRMQDADHPLNVREKTLFHTFFKMVESTISDKDGTVSAAELKKGLRYFNVYYSIEQCTDVITLVRKQHRSVSGRLSRTPSAGNLRNVEAPAVADSGCGPDEIEIAPNRSSPRRDAVQVAVDAASAAQAADAAQGQQESRSTWCASHGAAVVCPGFPRSLASFGAPVPLPRCSQEAALPLALGQRRRGDQRLGGRRTGGGSLSDEQRLAGALKQQEQQLPQRLDRDAGEAHDVQESPIHQTSGSEDFISPDEFRTFLIMLEKGEINPTPMHVTRFLDQRPSEIVDGLARYLFLTTYALCILVMLPTVTMYSSNADQ